MSGETDLPAIEHDESARLWVLHTPSSSYAVSCPQDIRVHSQRVADPLLHVYWGQRITLADAVDIDRLRRKRRPGRGWESPLDGAEEYPVDGGVRFGRPALAARYPGRVRSVQLRLAGWHVHRNGGAQELTVRLTDEAFGLALTLGYRVRDDVDVIERWAVATNESDDPIDLDRIDSAAWTLPDLGDYRLSHLTGRWAAETQLQTDRLPIGETVLTSGRRGASSPHANPWFALDDGTATEERGRVYTGALAWSGSWRMVAQRLPSGAVQVVGGAGHENFGPYRLAPGEQLTTPAFAALFHDGGFGGASRAWHDYQLRHVIPHADRWRPVLYNSWEATGFDVNEDNQRALAAKAAQLGVELFVVDDGWFGARTSAHAGLGDWWVNRDRFPNGLTPLIDEVRRLGMDFGLWVEPEMVNPDSDTYRAHPDWVYHFPDRARSQMRNQLVLNLARTDVADWVYERLDTLLSDHDIRYLKWDMNRAFTEAGWPAEADNPDRLWFDHVRNLYSIIDRLRAAHPLVAIESCASGGGRVDLGILARTDEVWASDNTDAADRLVIQHGFSQLYPARVMSAWVTDVPNFLDRRAVGLRYRFHVAMAGVLGVGGDLSTWSDDEMAEAAGLIADYQRVRHVVQGGRQYRLRPPQEGLSAVQYVSVDASESVVLAFLDAQRFGQPVPVLRLAGLDETARYAVEGAGTAAGGTLSGAVLCQHGLPLTLRGDHASVMVTLRWVA